MMSPWCLPPAPALARGLVWGSAIGPVPGTGRLITPRCFPTTALATPATSGLGPGLSPGCRVGAPGLAGLATPAALRLGAGDGPGALGRALLLEVEIHLAL